MDKTHTVSAKARNVRVLYEVLALELLLVVRVPVAADRKDIVGPLFDSDDVRQCDAIVILERIAVNDPIYVDLVDLVAVVVGQAVALLLGFLLLHIRMDVDGVAQVDVAVEPFNLQLPQVVLGLAHDVRHALSVEDARRPVRHDDLFGGDEHRHLPPQAGVEVDLLERSACKAQRVQHALVLRAILRHHLGKLVVHVVADTFGSFFLELGDGTNDLGLDRTRSGERLDDGVRLEAHSRFGQDSGVHATRAVPRLGALLILHAQDLKALDERIDPVLATGDVALHVTHQVRGKGLQLVLVKELSEVCVEVVGSGGICFRSQFNLHPAHANSQALGILDFNLDCRLVSKKRRVNLRQNAVDISSHDASLIKSTATAAEKLGLVRLI